MSILKQIRNSKRCIRVVVLLGFALLNGMFSQSYMAMPVVSENSQVAIVDYANHQDNTNVSMHMAHNLAQQNDCMDTDGACKSQCAWHCLLTQVVQPVPFFIDASTVNVADVPTYQSNFSVNAEFETTLRPPISI